MVATYELLCQIIYGIQISNLIDNTLIKWLKHHKYEDNKTEANKEHNFFKHE